jgi:2-polyprenyl-3-methyl-5-hydroxy-6-metoxy-1,4-benzoquinol methylase
MTGAQDENTRDYSFRNRATCDMCGSPANGHKIIGQRLSCSQGLRPRSKSGIAVSVVKCRNCSLIFANPQPIPIHSGEHDFIDSWTAEYFDYDASYFASEMQIAKDLLSFQPGMKVLDIGAGIGKGLRSFNNAGFDAFGIEPSMKACQIAVEKMGIAPQNIVCSTVEEAIFPDESFDFVNFGAVLEHVYSPATALKKALKWLKPEGIIFAEVPNSKYLISRLVNLYNRLWLTNYVTHISPMHSPYHHFEFALSSFEKFCEANNCEISRHQVFVCDTMFIPRIFVPIFDAYMAATKTGMQHSIFLRKKAGL